MRYLALAIALLASSAARAAEGAPPAAADATPSEPGTATAEPRKDHVWELDGFVGYGQLAYPAMDLSNTTWKNGNAAFAATVAYRGPHFTHPFLDISHNPFIASGSSVFVPGTGPSTFASNSTSAWGFVVGPGFDVDWFRIRGGIGLYSVKVSTTVNGQSNSVSQATLGFLAAASALVWRPEPFALGVEGRLVALQSPFSGIYQVSWELGLTGRWDFIRH